MAVSELGMSPKKFWKLDFYEWSLWVNRITTIQKKRNQDQELLIMLQRDWFALYANSNKGKNAEAFSPTDFYTLPGDEQKKKKIFANPEEFEEEMKKRVRRRKHG